MGSNKGKKRRKSEEEKSKDEFLEEWVYKLRKATRVSYDDGWKSQNFQNRKADPRSHRPVKDDTYKRRSQNDWLGIANFPAVVEIIDEQREYNFTTGYIILDDRRDINHFHYDFSYPVGGISLLELAVVRALASGSRLVLIYGDAAQIRVARALLQPVHFSKRYKHPCIIHFVRLPYATAFAAGNVMWTGMAAMATMTNVGYTRSVNYRFFDYRVVYREKEAEDCLVINRNGIGVRLIKDLQGITRECTLNSGTYRSILSFLGIWNLKGFSHALQHFKENEATHTPDEFCKRRAKTASEYSYGGIFVEEDDIVYIESAEDVFEIMNLPHVQEVEKMRREEHLFEFRKNVKVSANKNFNFKEWKFSKVKI